MQSANPKIPLEVKQHQPFVHLLFMFAQGVYMYVTDCEGSKGHHFPQFSSICSRISSVLSELIKKDIRLFQSPINF